MKRKIIFILIAVIAVSIFSGCGKTNIVCSIDENNMAQISIDALIPRLDISEEEEVYITSRILQLINYWEDNGYEANYTKDDDNYSFSIVKSESCDSPEEALDCLLSMMSAEVSPFSCVEGGYSPSFFNDIYNLSATLDLTSIIDYESLEQITPSHRKFITDALGEFSGTVTFDLYGQTVEYTGTMEGTKNSEELALDTPITLSRVIQFDHQENIDEYNTLLETIALLEHKQAQYKTIMYALITAAVVVLFLIIVLFMQNKKRNGGRRNVASRKDAFGELKKE